MQFEVFTVISVLAVSPLRSGNPGRPRRYRPATHLAFQYRDRGVSTPSSGTQKALSFAAGLIRAPAFHVRAAALLSVKTVTCEFQDADFGTTWAPIGVTDLHVQNTSTLFF